MKNIQIDTTDLLDLDNTKGLEAYSISDREAVEHCLHNLQYEELWEVERKANEKQIERLICKAKEQVGKFIFLR